MSAFVTSAATAGSGLEFARWRLVVNAIGVMKLVMSADGVLGISQRRHTQ